EYEITGPVSFSFGEYKIEPRTLQDIEILAPVYFTKALLATDIQKTSLSLGWETNSESTTEIFWGFTEELEQGYLSSTGSGTEHNIIIDGLQPADLIYVNAFSVFEGDTAFSGLQAFITQSESSGEMRVSFNRTPVDAGFTGNEDLFTDHLMDTLVFYIDQAVTSLDLALYDFTNHAAAGSNFENRVIDAINRASGRGVNVRLITDADVAGAITPHLNEIPVFEVNQDGIMHHKFIIVDHGSASNAWLVTGSTNPNYNNMFLDFNNLISIQDQSLAKAYLLEFNEIWGSDGMMPDAENSRSGNEKQDDSPHQFIIGGSEVELYFSPSDKTTTMISDQLAQAETSVEFAIMAFTENILGDAIVEAHDRGLEVKGIIDYVEFSGSEFDYLKDQGVDVLDYKNPDGSGWPDGSTLHHKYAIVDAGTENASVITGSHNWTASAESINDENTLIIHNQDIADLFLQEFNRIRDWLMNPPVMPVCRNDVYEVSTFDEQVFEVTSNDDIEGDFQIEITRQPLFGNMSISENNILYTPGQDFNSGNDTIEYKVSINSYPAFADSAMVIIVKETTGTTTPTDIPGVFRVYPNPANDFINIYFTSEEAEPLAVEVRNVQGQTVIRRDDIYPGYPLRIVSRDFNPGMYIISLKTSMGDIHRRIIKE
ncbi:MAG: phospholipase D-like domain-containing protein, partial [Bacteroidales bacterium]